MKKYLNIFVAVLLSALTFSLSSCGDDDEPDGGGGSSSSSTSFTFNGEKMYVGTMDFNMPQLIYSPRSEQMQIGIYLYKSKEDIYPSVAGDIEIEVFDPSTYKKGQKLEIITGKYTCIEEQLGNTQSTNVALYFKNITGSITFEGYNSSTNIVVLKFNNVKLEDNNSQTCVLNGSLNCDYDDNGYLTQYSGIW